MRIFVAGGSSLIGRRVVHLLVEGGNEVAAMTRSRGAVEKLRALGAQPILCDVYDREALTQAVVDFAPSVVIDELTDLPDDASEIAAFGEANARIRTEGTRNLLDAATAAGAAEFLVQSVAWELPGRAGEASKAQEEMVLAWGGAVLRYGQFYGPDSYHPEGPPPSPAIHLDEAARRTVEAIGGPSGILTLVEEP